MTAQGPEGFRPKRMLPSVSEVVKELSKETASDPGELFTVARKVCAEELNRVKQGLESAPLGELVLRARRILNPSEVPAPPAGSEPTALLFPSQMADDPFSETTGALDLKWDRVREEPLGEVVPDGGASEKTEYVEAPPAAGRVPEPPRSTTTQPPAILLAEESPLGSDEKTIAGVEPEAMAVDLKSVLPRSAFAVEPAAAERPASRAAEMPIRTDEPSRRGPLVLFLLGVVVVLGLGAGLYLRFWRGPAGTTEPVATPVPLRPRRPAAAVPTAPSGTPAAPPAVATATVSTPPRGANAPVPPTPVPARTVSRATPTVAMPPTQVPTKAPPPVARPVAPVATVAPAAPPVRTPPPAKTSPSAAKPPAPPITVATEPPPRQRNAAPLVTKDWAGKAPVFVLHFSSYKDRASAEKEAASLGKKLGQPGHAVEVDLGAKGMWHRVVVGEFPTADEALAFRADLEAKGMPGMGFVYRMTGK